MLYEVLQNRLLFDFSLFSIIARHANDDHLWVFLREIVCWLSSCGIFLV